MSAPTAETFDLSYTRPTSFARLTMVELRKMWDTRAGAWLLGITLGLGAVAQIIALVVTTIQDVSMTLGDFASIFAFVSSVLLPVLGILLVTSEWSQRTAMTTFTLEPRRGMVVGAKLVAGVVFSVLTVLFALVTGVVCNAVYGLLQSGADWTLGWRGLTAFLVTQVLSIVGGFALACLILNSPGAIVAFFAYKWVVPGIIGIGSALMQWFADLAPWIDFQSAQAVLYEGHISGQDWAQLLVSGGLWVVVPLVLGLMRILRAEVK